jgi:hypothetical protein
MPRDIPGLPNLKTWAERLWFAAPSWESELTAHSGSDYGSEHYGGCGRGEAVLYLGRRPSGRGAIDMTPAEAKSGVLVRGLRPALPFLFRVMCEDAQSKPSKPSKPATATLVDTFKEK